MECRIGIVITTLLVSNAIHAQAPPPGDVPAATQVSEAPSRHNSKIVIKTEPLRNNTIDVELNGKRIASMDGEQIFAGVFSPGRMRITVPGGKPEGSIELTAEPNKEYLFNVAYMGSPSAPGFLLFGLVGAMAMADHSYSIVLKETREMFPKPPHLVVAESVGAPTYQPTQRGIQHLQTQSAAIRSDTPPEKPASTTSSSPTAEKLRELRSLLEQRLITQEEYDAKRKAILDGMLGLPPVSAPSSASQDAPPSVVAPASKSSQSDPRYSGIQFPAAQGPKPQPPKVPAMSFEVEKAAKTNGCAPAKAAELLTESGPIETYRVKCIAGSELIVKCEYRNCRVLH